MDPQLVEKIVHEVKSQGVFDEFRKDSMADVDTKPAYQNLRQRVESAVKKFLSEQRWTPEMNKNQLRERLRRRVEESGFLDVGVERIVDQVVNPKIGSVFQPRIEEIAYKYLGVAPPQIKCEPPPPQALIHPLPPLPLNGAALKVETASLMPTDLEQVSPDSDKKSEYKDESQDMDIEDANEDDESPPFEPLVKCSSPVAITTVKSEPPLPALKSEVDMEASVSPPPCSTLRDAAEDVTSRSAADVQNLDNVSQDTSVSTAELDSEKEVSRSLDAVASQESQLSQVSSDSRITTSTRDSTIKNTGPSQLLEDAAVNISEEAQMPKFSENSSETNGGRGISQLHFDINKDKIKFEGTERKTNLLPESSNTDGYFGNGDPPESLAAASKDVALDGKDEDNHVETNNTFPFDNSNVQCAAERTPIPAADSSFGSSLDDTNSAQLVIAEKSKSEPMSQSEQMEQKSLVAPPPFFGALQPRERDESGRHSSSSSRHKKHSKDKRRRSHDKDSRKKSKERDRDRDRHSRGKHSHSSSGSKHSSSAKNAEGMHRSDKGSSSSTAKPVTSSSSSSSTRSEAHESLRREKHGESHKRHSSSGAGSKEPKKSEQKTQKGSNDDHNESKEKLHWRKSTDSNDEDKNPGGAGGAISQPTKLTALTNTNTNTTSSSSSGGGGNKSKSKGANDSSTHSILAIQPDLCTMQNKEYATSEPQSHRSKVVILNDILQNPSTNFIELETAAYANHVVRSTYETPPLQVESAADELCFFEEVNGQFAARLKLLDSAMDSCRRAINGIRFDTPLGVFDLYDTLSQKHHPQATRATLLIDCISYGGADDDGSSDPIDFEAKIENTPRKRMKYSESCNAAVIKASPTLSDVSVNSKENESLDKNFVGDLRRRNIAMSKISQQRYTSEDLYKPRPILSHRSKRRGVDSVI